jgi:hypothetical protein
LIQFDGSLDKVPVSKPIPANNRLFAANLYMGTFTAGVNPSATPGKVRPLKPDDRRHPKKRNRLFLRRPELGDKPLILSRPAEQTSFVQNPDVIFTTRAGQTKSGIFRRISSSVSLNKYTS